MSLPVPFARVETARDGLRNCLPQYQENVLQVRALLAAGTPLEDIWPLYSRFVLLHARQILEEESQ